MLVGSLTAVLCTHDLFLQLLSLVLLDPGHSHSLLPSDVSLLFTTKWACLLFCSAPLTGAVLMPLGHAYVMYAEQVRGYTNKQKREQSWKSRLVLSLCESTFGEIHF